MENDITIKDGDGTIKGEVIVDYPDNSYNKKKDEKEKPVAHGRPVKRKKTFKERFKDFFFEPEGSEGYDYVYEDIIRPAAIDMVSDIAHNMMDAIRDTVDTALFGSPRGARRRDRGYYRTSYDDYDEYWNRERKSRRRERERDEDDRRYSKRSDEVAAKVESRSEAVDLIHAMQDRVHRFKVASVLNFYDLADMPTKSVDDDYGWDLGHPFEATITRVRDGYIVEPCAPIWLDR